MKVSDAHFGLIYTGYPQDADFLAVMDELGGHISRWPGGTLAEVRRDVYDIATESIFDPTFLYQPNENRSRLNIEEAIEYSQGSSNITMVIPTYRYKDDLSQGISDFDLFMSNLNSNPELQGVCLKLEIGNEFYDYEDFSAMEYGQVANEFISALSEVEFSNFEVEVIVQMGRIEGDNLDIISEIDEANLEYIDALSFHVLPINLNNLYESQPSGFPQDRFAAVANRYSEWGAKFESVGLLSPEMRVTAWSVGASASDASDLSLSFQDFGARGGVTALALFGELLHLGVSEASAWGVGVTNLNSLGVVAEGVVELSHVGALFSELRDSVTDLDFISGPGMFDWSDVGVEVGSQAYVGNGRLVLYVANGGSSADVSIDLANVLGDVEWGAAEIVDVRRIQTVYDDGYTPQGTDQDRLYERPEIVSFVPLEQAIMRAEPFLNVNLTSPYQIVEYTITWRHIGSESDDVVSGYSLDDELAGMGGNDTIFGYAGSDYLLGGDGDDALLGGEGADSIEGGIGNDIIIADGSDLEELHFLLNTDDFMF